MALEVPRQQFPFIQKLLELPDEKVQELLGALAEAGHKFNVFDLASHVAVRTKLPKPLLEGILQVVASLYITKDAQACPLATFVDEQVRPALKEVLAAPSDSQPEESDLRWNRLRRFLMSALSLDDTVGVASKTGRVMTEHERIFLDARVITDIRPIFHLTLSEKPTAAVLVHMLRMTARDAYNTRTDQFFALDANDIRLLKDLVDRAIKKEETLKVLMKQADVDIIEPGTIF